MDSNRRHKLAQNTLAYWISKQYDEWIRPYGQWIGLAALVIAVLLVIFVGTTRLQESNRREAWAQYSQALVSEKREENLQIIAETTSGPVANQARLSLAQIQLAEGCNAVLFDKKKAEESLTKAVDHFQAAEKHAADMEQRRQAVFGEAEAWETLAAVRTGKSDLAEAEKTYARVVELWPDDYWGKKAKDKLDFIKRPDTQKFFELAAARVIEAPAVDGPSVEIDRDNPGLDGPGGFNLEMFETPGTPDNPKTEEAPKTETGSKSEEVKQPESEKASEQ